MLINGTAKHVTDARGPSETSERPYPDLERSFTVCISSQLIDEPSLASPPRHFNRNGLTLSAPPLGDAYA